VLLEDAMQTIPLLYTPELHPAHLAQYTTDTRPGSCHIQGVYTLSTADPVCAVGPQHLAPLITWTWLLVCSLLSPSLSSSPSNSLHTLLLYSNMLANTEMPQLVLNRSVPVLSIMPSTKQ